ncbi:hypothetical protein F2P81_006507 [Scophthalmus maximus]|uniref:MANSC domain-containing protein n=1 Tax=Scophthalmus maximus TaxID=52904 RepID=A0A6A4T6V6_SCOMX|nr:hypothetical protein F2P81_006507 [Scophthalmus maximus]
MNVTRGLLAVLSVLRHAEASCSPTSYYKNCWIRRFPGIFLDIGESQRRGAQLLRHYQEETALKCSRTCCLTRNFSCNLAIFHYDATQENVNCFHLHCPTLESCILSHRGNVVLYNITKGVDPDLLVFGKYFTSNVRVLPHHYSRANASEPLPSDKRHFLHPPPPAVPPLTSAPTGKPPTIAGRVLSTTAAATMRSISQPTVVSTTTTPLSSPSPAPLTDPGNRAQTTAPTTSTISFAPSFTAPPSTTTDATRGHRDPDTTNPSPVRSTTTTQPPTSAPTQPHSTTSPLSATIPPTTTASTGNMGSSKQYPNETEGTLGRNHTAGVEGDQGVGGEDPVVGSGAGWHQAAHTLLVAVAICITVLLSCCCSILLVVSWRGQRKRMGRYRTSWRGKRGSMRLIKYVLVRERS